MAIACCITWRPLPAEVVEPQPNGMTTMDGKRHLLVLGLHVFVLAGFVLAQPTYDMLARSPEFLVAHNCTPARILALSGVLSFAIPGALVLIGLCAALRYPGLGIAILRIEVGALAALGCLLVFSRLTRLHGAVAYPLAIGVGAAAVAAHRRSVAFRMLLTVVSPSVLLFPAIFLCGQPTRSFVLGSDVPPGERVASSGLPSVVMVVLDEFASTTLMTESHEIDAARFPHLAALARDATWFRNATTVHYETQYAVPSLLTGRMPRQGPIPTYLDMPESLFSLLAPTHELQVYENYVRLCPPSWNRSGYPPSDGLRDLHALVLDTGVAYLHAVAPADHADKLPEIQDWKDFHTGRMRRHTFGHRAAVFEAFVKNITATSQPTLHWFHLLIPHMPYEYLPSGKVYSGKVVDRLFGDRCARHSVGLVRPRWLNDATAVTQSYQRYLLQCEYVDELIGRLVERLKEVDLYDQSLLLIASDHGVCIRPGESRRELLESNYMDILPSVLVIKPPGQRQGTISDRNVETIDVLPTIAHVLGLKVPWECDGQSALDTALPERPQKIAYGPQWKRLTFDPALPAKAEGVRRMWSMLGGVRDRDSIYRMGPRPELIGRRIDELPTDSTESVPVTIDDQRMFSDWKPERLFAPCFITGHIDAKNRPATPLAVAVNGVIWSVTRTLTIAGFEGSWSALVPEHALRAGRNEVEAVVLRENTEDTIALRNTELAR